MHCAARWSKVAMPAKLRAARLSTCATGDLRRGRRRRRRRNSRWRRSGRSHSPAPQCARTLWRSMPHAPPHQGFDGEHDAAYRAGQDPSTQAAASSPFCLAAHSLFVLTALPPADHVSRASLFPSDLADAMQSRKIYNQKVIQGVIQSKVIFLSQFCLW